MIIKPLSAAVATMFLCAGLAHAADAADCEKQATEKKLAGAAKNSFVKKCAAAGAAGASAPAASPAAEACGKQAAEKKLHGAAKNSFVKKCVADAK